MFRPCQPSCQTLENNFRTHFQSPYVVSHTRRCLDGSTLATLFCLNYFAANLGYKYLFLLHEKQSTLGVWKTAPTSAAWATAFYSICSHFCNCCTYSHSVCSKMKKKNFPSVAPFQQGAHINPPLIVFLIVPSSLFVFWTRLRANNGNLSLICHRCRQRFQLPSQIFKVKRTRHFNVGFLLQNERCRWKRI